MPKDVQLLLQSQMEDIESGLGKVEAKMQAKDDSKDEKIEHEEAA
jgi:hypothetical protein